MRFGTLLIITGVVLFIKSVIEIFLMEGYGN